MPWRGTATAAGSRNNRVQIIAPGPGKRDDEHSPGNGFINVFDTSGNFLRRLVSNGALNSTGASLGTINRADGTPLELQGLWDMLVLGDGVYFTAGIADEEHGLFGLITED